MLHGIEIMLKRMKTHPEEFIVEGKYTAAFHRAKPYLTDEEVEAVKTALAEAHRVFFTGEVMSIMAGEDDAISSMPKTYSPHPPSLSDYLINKVNLNTYGDTVTLSNTAVQDAISRSTGTMRVSAFGADPVYAEGAT